MLIPSVYGAALFLAIVTAASLYSPTIYVQTHRIAIASAGASFLVMILSQLAAYLRPTNYEARKRVTILAMGTFASVTPAFVLLVLSTYTGGGAAENLIAWAGAFFPISVAYAVLKADALQVDAILRRTVNYAILTIVVATAYATLIGGIEWVVRDHGDAPRWISILAFSSFCTFGILPLRNKVQSWVDKLFFRSAYDFRVTIEETSEILARLVQLDLIRERIKDVVFDALCPESIDFFVYDESTDNSLQNQSSKPTDGAITDASSGGIAIPFRSHDRVVALLVLGRRLSGRFYSGEDRALLQVLANQGAIAIENALALERLRDLNRTLETRVESRTAELASTIEELKETQVQLIQAERLAAVGELAAGVAHEVNNPLNFARNSLRTLHVMVEELSSYACAIGQLEIDNVDRFAEQLEGLTASFRETDVSELADDVKQLVEILGSGLDRTAALVEDLRDFASPRPNEITPFDLAEAVRSTFELADFTLREAQIEVYFDFDESVPMALGDRSSMSQVILNVIKNSVDALDHRGHGTLNVSINQEPYVDMLRLTISDNGPGIESELVDSVFEPFVTTKSSGKGTGLGLAMCRRTMHENSGNIWIDSYDESGTRIVIEIPTETGGAAIPA
jgi:signal transduction histidine kinase